MVRRARPEGVGPLPKQYGTKSADVVAAHIVGMLFDGRLRPGHRIDRNLVAAELGLSRVPVQEALVRLERDGIVTTRYHRGAYVERFDATVVREHYDLFGLLNGYAARVAAGRVTEELAAELARRVRGMRAATDPDEFDAHAWHFRHAVNDVAAGPRLRAALRSFASFIPGAYRLSWPAGTSAVLPYYEREHDGIVRGDGDAAARAAVGRAALLAELTVAELVRRGVFPPERAATGAPA